MARHRVDWDAAVDQAMVIFYRDGFQASSIDKVLKELGLNKRSFYDKFGSKEALMAAALRRRHELFTEWFFSEMDKLASTPVGKLLAVFDVLKKWFETETFNGCMFIRATVEMGKESTELAHISNMHKLQFRRTLVELARQAGADDPEALGRSIFLLKEGAIITMQITCSIECVQDAKRTAKTVLRDALSRDLGLEEKALLAS